MNNRRTGVTLIEVTAAFFVMATTTGICIQMLVALAHQQRAAERFSWATESATNLMERFTAQSYGEITPEAAAQLRLPEEVSQVLSEATVDVEVIEQQAPVIGKQVRLNLRWSSSHGKTSPKVTLSAWVFQNGRPSP